MALLRNPSTLYQLCLELLVLMLRKVANSLDWQDETFSNPLDVLSVGVAEDVLLEAHRRCVGRGAWRLECGLYLTPAVTRAVLAWDKAVLAHAARRCQHLAAVLVSSWAQFSPESLRWLPRSVTTLDLDGELFFRGTRGPFLQFTGRSAQPWLPDAERTLRALHVLRQKPPHVEHPGVLTELHLGDAALTAAQLGDILLKAPLLRLLRHYRLVKALYDLHSRQWRNSEGVPVYKLRNLDADFSHIGGCDMDPSSMLAPDALMLAARLCPEAHLARVRYDCSTPHDVLAPLCGLRHLRELSVVCVTSGERSQLDFSDVAKVLVAHGRCCLTSLELKVIEEVDVHVISGECPRLERLVLSGCGNVYPETCSTHGCARTSARRGPRLARLRNLFFADGDDFSWDHAVPQCFWFSVLAPGKPVKPSRLQGIFLESPRMSVPTADKLFFQRGQEATTMYPDLQVLSVCRFPELNWSHLQPILGLGTSSESSSLLYVRLSDCEQLGRRQEKRLRNVLKQAQPTRDVALVVD